MKKILVLIVLFCAGVCRQSLAKNDVRERIASNGNYVGLQKETYVDPEEPDAKWFHENTLLVRNNEAILDEVPVVVNHGKKGYSPSDGGFFTYRARFTKRDGQIFVALRLCQSDYLVFPVDKHDQYTEIKSYPVRLTSDGIEFNGVKYAPAKVNKLALKRLLRLLSSESLEKPGTNP